MIVIRNFLSGELCDAAHREYLREVFKPEDMPGRSYARSHILEDYLGYETYIAGYTKGAKLPIHIDSEREYFHVMSISISYLPGPHIWPLWVAGEAVYLGKGDAVLYSSRVPHWRENMPAALDFMSVAISKVPLTHIDIDT